MTGSERGGPKAGCADLKVELYFGMIVEPVGAGHAWLRFLNSGSPGGVQVDGPIVPGAAHGRHGPRGKGGAARAGKNPIRIEAGPGSLVASAYAGRSRRLSGLI